MNIKTLLPFKFMAFVAVEFTTRLLSCWAFGFQFAKPSFGNGSCALYDALLEMR